MLTCGISSLDKALSASSSQGYQQKGDGIKKQAKWASRPGRQDDKKEYTGANKSAAWIRLLPLTSQVQRPKARRENNSETHHRRSSSA